MQQIGDKIILTGADGTDTLSGIEPLHFADGVVSSAASPPETPSGSHISGLFDTVYYLTNNPDVLSAGVSAIDHFNTLGWREGRNPNAFLDVTGYVAANDIPAGMSPIDHYHQIGGKQGRDPGASFDTKLYLLHNPHVAAGGRP